MKTFVLPIVMSLALVTGLQTATAASDQKKAERAAANADTKGERAPKNPEAKVRFVGKGEIASYVEGQEIVIHATGGYGKGEKLKLAIGNGQWPHLGSVFYEVIFTPPAGYENDFPIHSPMKPDRVKAGHEVWFALEGTSAQSLQLYQIACRISSPNPAQFNATVRNAVMLREARNQEQIARDYQCRLIESPKGSGEYPDDPTLLEHYVPQNSISSDRLSIKTPPPNHDGYGKGLKSSDVYENGIGSQGRNRQPK
jgi:hypothetical protein